MARDLALGAQSWVHSRPSFVKKALSLFDSEKGSEPARAGVVGAGCKEPKKGTHPLQKAKPQKAGHPDPAIDLRLSRPPAISRGVKKR